MICNVLCVGTELLLGQIVDTNSSFIGEQLQLAGIDSLEHRRVGDNPDRIATAITELIEHCDALIITGGLGPTHDDITREVTATVMGVETQIDNGVLSHMEEVFSRRGRKMPETNLRQAMVPVGAIVIENNLGTAPGLICPLGKKFIYLVPGVPHELEPMIKNTIIDHLLSQEVNHSVIYTRTLKSWSIPESELSVLLGPLIEDCEIGPVKIGFLARGINGIYVKLSTKANSIEIAKAQTKIVENKVRDVLGDSIYATDEETMESVVVELLKNQNLKLAVAESLTGGMVQSRLVDVEGVSAVLNGGVVSYSKDIKESILNVTAEDVYSHECAQQMALGVREKFGADISISTTGVAGPDDENGHIKGEVYIGLSTSENTYSRKYLLGGDRMRVRQYATITALDLLRRHLMGVNSTSISSE